MHDRTWEHYARYQRTLLRPKRTHNCAEKKSTMRPSPWGQHSYALALAQPPYPSASTHHHLHNTIYTTPSTQHHLHNTIYTTPSTLHRQHNIINTHTPSTLHHQQTSSTQPHQYITIYRTPSTQHDLHNIIHTTPSTLHHHILASAALGALPSHPFCLIPADTPLVVLRCGLFFVLFC